MTNLEAALEILKDGQEWTIWSLRTRVMHLTGRMCSETGLSGQVRDLRKVGYDIQGRYLLDAQGRKTKSYVYFMAKPQAMSAVEAERILNA